MGREFRSKLVGAALAMLVLSCGRRELVSASTRLSGWVYLSGPVAGATVHAWRIDDACQKVAEVATSAATGADGSFTLTIGA